MRKCCVVGSMAAIVLLSMCLAHTSDSQAHGSLGEWITDTLQLHVIDPAYLRRLEALTAASTELTMAPYYHSPLDWTTVLNSRTREIEILGSLSLYDGGRKSYMRQIEAMEVDRSIAELESTAKSVILEVVDLRLLLHADQQKSEYVRRGMAAMAGTQGQERLLMELQLRLDSIASESRLLCYQLSKKTNNAEEQVDIISLPWPELELDRCSAVESIRTNPGTCAAYRMHDIDSKIRSLLNSVPDTMSISAQLSARVISDEPLQTRLALSATIPLGDPKWAMGTCNVEADGAEYLVYARLNKRKSVLSSLSNGIDWTQESATTALNDYIFSLEQAFDMLSLSETQLLLIRDQMPNLSMIEALGPQDKLSVVTAWLGAAIAEAEAEYRYRSSLFRILLLIGAFDEELERAIEGVVRSSLCE